MFYDDQMTHHAAALTYYVLMSLFPTGLVALSLLVLFGQYPATYDAIVDYLRDVAPASVVDPLDRSLRDALQSRGTATTALVFSIPCTLRHDRGARGRPPRAQRRVRAGPARAQLPAAQDDRRPLRDRAG